MAEFTLGLTKTAVEGTLSLVKSALEEEKKLWDKVQNDLVFITGEFEVMQSFLHVANRKHAANEVALTLVRQLRTLAFDVEDCVELIVHLDKSSRWGWLWRLWQMVNCRAPPLPLDVAVAEIKQLKARVEEVSQRNMRYNSLILHGSDNSNNKQQQPVTVMMPPAEEPPYATTTTFPSSKVFHVLRDAWKATGKWSSNMCNLQQELLISHEGEGEDDLQVISVWGSTTGGGGADLGTASIFRKAYHDPKICENFKIRAWVKLTHPFNHDEFVKSLLAQFSVSSSHQANDAGVDFSRTRKKTTVVLEADNLMEQMQEQRYLVVLEDLFMLEEWNVIKMYLPDSKNGSRIVVSTPQFWIALTCTGKPYQVSELKKFPGDNQFLCAFSKKEKTPREIGEFVRQLLRRHGVISVWGADNDDKLNLVDILYKGIINGWLEEIEGVADKSDHVDMFYKGIRNRRRKFERHSSWVDVPDPFNQNNLKVFAQRLFLNFHSDDIRAREVTEVGMMGEAELIQWCREFLCEDDEDYHYVVVINGVQSKGDWDLIQSTFFSSKATTAKAGCILVITNEETVATHCVKDHTHLAFNAKDLKADPSISTLINKGCWHYAIRGKKGRLFYDRRIDAQEWANKFKNVGGINPDQDEGKDEQEGFRVFTVTVDGSSEEGVLRHSYYGALFQRRSSWVDVPLSWWDDRVDLTDFSWRLLLDFYSDDPQAKEEVAVGLMEGTIIDPIEKCREFLRNQKCLVVIHGLRSIKDWDSIKFTFFYDEQHIQSIIIVGLAPMSGREENYFYHTTKALRLGTKPQGRLIDMIAWEGKELTSSELELAKSIVAKCGGLPKVITAIGDACRWGMVDSLRENFMGTAETLPEFHGLRPLFSWMKSYFDAWSDSIKRCVFYLSIFPPDKNIRPRRLLWRWIAEGYCRDTSNGRTSEENGEKIISELISWIEIQHSPSNKVLCKINGFLHEYIISRPMEDNLVFELEGRCCLNSTRAGQHLTIRSTWDRSDKVVYKSIDFSRLRSLTVFGEWKSFFICSKKVNMRLLRVLDLEDAEGVTNDDLEQVAKRLTRLKFLSLRGCREITRLPSSMGGLRQLQTLDVRHTSIVMLPLFITKLQKLRYIRAGTTTPEAWDWEGGDVVLTAEAYREEDRASSSAQAVTNFPPPAAAAATPKEGGTGSTAPVILPPVAAVSCNNLVSNLLSPVLAPDAGNNRPRTLVSSLLSKLCRSGGGPAAGVKVTAGIKKLAVLHTLGVVNVNGTASTKSIFFEELKKLTQLRKLGVSGINKGNIKEFCRAISDHGHLRSLSMELDKDDNLDGLDGDDIPQPPKTLKSLKLYGHVNKLLVWIGQPGNNLEKLKLDLTIEKPEELRALESSIGPDVGHLQIRPIRDGELTFRGRGWAFARFVEIQCTSRLHIKFEDWNYYYSSVEVLKVHFSGGSQSSLQISGLSELRSLKEVWLKGYTDAHKQYMQRQIDEMELKEWQKRPVLKLVQPRSP